MIALLLLLTFDVGFVSGIMYHCFMLGRKE